MNEKSKVETLKSERKLRDKKSKKLVNSIQKLAYERQWSSLNVHINKQTKILVLNIYEKIDVTNLNSKD